MYYTTKQVYQIVLQIVSVRPEYRTQGDQGWFSLEIRLLHKLKTIIQLGEFYFHSKLRNYLKQNKNDLDLETMNNKYAFHIDLITPFSYDWFLWIAKDISCHQSIPNVVKSLTPILTLMINSLT